MQATVVVLTKLPGHLPVKTRLWPVLGEEGARRLYLEMLRETLVRARRVDPVPTVAYSPPEVEPRLDLGGACRFLPVAGEGGAQCLENAVAAAFCGLPLVVLGGDAPDLPDDRIDGVVAELSGGRDAVFVPTGDGGFSCLGLRRPVAGLASGFRYGGNDALASLEAFLTDRGLCVARMEGWPDVDTPADLDAYNARKGS